MPEAAHAEIGLFIQRCRIMTFFKSKTNSVMAGVNKTLSLFLIGLIPFFSTMGSTYSADSENQKTGKGTSVEERLAHVFAKGKFNVNLRYRYEFVDQDGLNRNAHANTLRARIGYTTGTFYGFSANAA
ncbi:MAG: hypothetical protein ACO3MW_05635, partial [Rhodospirillales bacterium]